LTWQFEFDIVGDPFAQAPEVSRMDYSTSVVLPPADDGCLLKAESLAGFSSKQ
jgi:hypothetical protein